jgi:hypothetical protein
MMIINTSISYFHKNSFQYFKGLFNHKTSMKIRWAYFVGPIHYTPFVPITLYRWTRPFLTPHTKACWPDGSLLDIGKNKCPTLRRTQKYVITLQTKMVHNFQLYRKRISFFYQFHRSPKSPFWGCPNWKKKLTNWNRQKKNILHVTWWKECVSYLCSYFGEGNHI